MSQIRAAITSLGRHVPERVVTNADLAKFVDTNDEWIRTRTGIHERHYVEKGTPTSVIAAKAAQDCLERRGIAPSEVDLIIIATVTPDMFFPATACIVQDKIGATRAWGFDISGACSGFVYALTMGAQFVKTGAHKKVLVIGADVMTSILDWEDRTTCVLFGDAAGAVLLEPRTDGTGMLDFANEVDGTGGSFLYMQGGGSLHPPTHETIDQKLHSIRQDGAHVFKYAVRKFAEVERGPARTQRVHRRGSRHVRAPPGQRPHHQRRPGAHGHARLEGGEEHRPLRQHDRGDDPAGDGYGARRGPAEGGQPGDDGRGRRGLHGRVPRWCAGRDSTGSRRTLLLAWQLARRFRPVGSSW